MNERAAQIFSDCADVLRLQKANPFRVNAYIRAARSLRSMDTDAGRILENDGIEGLMKLPGIGKGLAAAIRAGLAEVLRRGSRYQEPALAAPSVGELLAVDADYRRLAAAGKLPKIAPKRFNPEGRAWLPVMHTVRGDWHFTALFSNTARAHELGRTDDWVVIYYYDGDHQEGQNTVVTETHGPLRGERVVRGREREARSEIDQSNTVGTTRLK